MSCLFLLCLLFRIFVTLPRPYPNSSLLNYKQMILPATKENSKSMGSEGCQDLTVFCLTVSRVPSLTPYLKVNLSICIFELSGLVPSGLFKNKALLVITSLYLSPLSLAFYSNYFFSLVATQIISANMEYLGKL